MSRFHTFLAAAAGAALLGSAGSAFATGLGESDPYNYNLPASTYTYIPPVPVTPHGGPTDRNEDPYNYSAPASSYTYIPPVPMTPHGGPTDRNVDPYVYNYDANASPMVEQPARAESCFYEKPIFNKAGKLIGHKKVNGCAK